MPCTSGNAGVHPRLPALRATVPSAQHHAPVLLAVVRGTVAPPRHTEDGTPVGQTRTHAERSPGTARPHGARRARHAMPGTRQPQVRRRDDRPAAHATRPHPAPLARRGHHPRELPRHLLGVQFPAWGTVGREGHQHPTRSPSRHHAGTAHTSDATSPAADPATDQGTAAMVTATAPDPHTPTRTPAGRPGRRQPPNEPHSAIEALFLRSASTFDPHVQRFSPRGRGDSRPGGPAWPGRGMTGRGVSRFSIAVSTATVGFSVFRVAVLSPTAVMVGAPNGWPRVLRTGFSGPQSSHVLGLRGPRTRNGVRHV